MQEAVTKGITVAECVARLLRIHWSLKRLHSIFVERIAATPVYELKMAFSLHALYCAEHVEEFAKRVREMRQPPYGLEVSPDANLDLFFNEISAAPDVAALVLGLYTYAVPAVTRALERLIADTNKLFDHPTYRICRLTLVEMQDVMQYGAGSSEMPGSCGGQELACGMDDPARRSVEGRRRPGWHPAHGDRR